MAHKTKKAKIRTIERRQQQLLELVKKKENPLRQPRSYTQTNTTLEVKHQQQSIEKKENPLRQSHSYTQTNLKGMMIQPIERLNIICNNSKEDYFRYVAYALASLCSHNHDALEKDLLERMKRTGKAFVVIDLWGGTLIVSKAALPIELIAQKNLVKLTSYIYIDQLLQGIIIAYNIGKTITVHEDHGISTT